MKTFSLWKQLKRRLRRSRRPLWTLGGILGLLAISGTVLLPQTADASASRSHNYGSTSDAVDIAHHSAPPSITQYLQNSTGEFPVMLRRVYVCGEEIEQLGSKDAHSVISLLSDHPEWSASLYNDRKTVIIVQHIEDISDYCRQHAHFGVDRLGNFSLFDGIPKEEKVMRTFFQLDIRYMESSLPRQQLDSLNRGIRVKDMDEYNSVISTFSDYAVDRNGKSKKQAY